MSLTLWITPLAKQDIDDIADYIAVDNLDAALRFIDATEKTCGQLISMPALGALCGFHSSLAADVRVWQVSGYENYLIFYRADEVRLEVIRVIHGACDYKPLFEWESS